MFVKSKSRNLQVLKIPVFPRLQSNNKRHRPVYKIYAPRSSKGPT